MGNGLRLENHGGAVAILDPAGTWTYAVLAEHAARLSAELRGDLADLGEARVALLCTPGHDFVVGMLACWHAGGLAVPLHPSHPDAELAYFLADSETTIIVCSPELEELAAPSRRRARRDRRRDCRRREHAPQPRLPPPRTRVAGR